MLDHLGDMNQAEARDAVDAVRRDVDSLIERLNELWCGRAWIALGYGSWSELCVTEFPNRQLPRADRAEAVGELRAAGMSTRAIGDALGVSNGTVHGDLAGVQNRTPHSIIGNDGKSYPSKVRADDAAFAERIKNLDPVRVRAMLTDDDENDDHPCWVPSGAPIVLDTMAIVVVASVDYKERADADVFGPFASIDEADQFAGLVPFEPFDGGYPPQVQVFTVANLVNPTSADWLQTEEDN